jgi:hypothetical protein
MGCSLTNLWSQVRKCEKHGPLQQEPLALAGTGAFWM